MVAKRLREIILLGIAMVIVVADQVSKSWVRQHAIMGVPWDPVPWLRPVLSITYGTNTGAAFGLFPQFGGIYAMLAVVVIAMILFLHRYLAAQGWLIQASLALQLGGAVGNLIDRLARGTVTDFIDLNFWPMQQWAVFNVADSALVVGVCVLAVHLLFTKESPPATTPAIGNEG